MTLHPSVDWFFHRVASSDRYSASLREIQDEWTLDDVLDAHLVLDAFEEADRRAAAKIPGKP